MGSAARRARAKDNRRVDSVATDADATRAQWDVFVSHASEDKAGTDDASPRCRGVDREGPARLVRSRLNEGIKAVNERSVPVLKQQSGFRSFVGGVNRDNGAAITGA